MRAERRRKKLIRRGIVAGVFVAIVAGVMIWRAASANQPAADVMVVSQPTYTGPFTTQVTGSGSIKPASSTLVSPQIDGTIETVNVVSGQQVAAGDVLFTIKNDDLDRAVAEAERGVRAAQTALDQANQALKDAKAAKNNAAAATGQITTPSAGDHSASLAQGVSDAEAGVQGAQLQLEAAQATRDQAVEQADKRTVRAPIAGSVIELNAQPGAALGQSLGSGVSSAAGTGALCQIADLSQMTVTVQVSEVDINKMQVDQAATATFSAVTDVSLDATVRSIATTSSGDGSMGYGYGSGGVTYAVELVIPAPDARLKPGMTANVSIVTDSIDSALIVPALALSDFGDGTGMLYVEDDPETHAAHTVMVTILGNNGSEAAVEPLAGSPLADGDAVVVAGTEALQLDEDGALADGGMGMGADAGADGADGGDSGSSSGSVAVAELAA